MTEDKLKRVTVAATVCSVVLICILLFVLIFQVITIIVKNNRIKDYNEQIQILKELKEERADELDIHKQEWKILARARELGYRFPGDIDVTNNDN